MVPWIFRSPTFILCYLEDLPCNLQTLFSLGFACRFRKNFSEAAHHGATHQKEAELVQGRRTA
ncbi:MAG: hypothetical protein EBS01_07300 [Verrucomicrobia bacterium]|nr:hypothetical protein [Verrucomicrobiota bacterium]